MAATSRQEAEMKRHCESNMHKVTDPMKKLRMQCLCRGSAGIKGIGRCDLWFTCLGREVLLVKVQYIVGGLYKRNV